MKNYLKNTWQMYVISFVFCFMLFLYEPLMMYIGNITDFWFGISLMFKMTGLLFLLVYFIIIVIFNIIYFVNKKDSKKIFKICVVIMFVIFFCSYIQGNYLVGNLPILDGTPIDWSSYKVDWIISLVLWIVVITGIIFAIKKLTLNKVIKYSGFVSLAILFMLSLSLLMTYMGSSELKEKEVTPLVTYKNINKYSSNNNFIILLLDCTDSKAFYRRMNADKDFKDVFNDFTYYPDTMSGHPLTTESIPLVLTGKYYQNQAPIVKWATEAYKESGLFKLVEDNNYELDVYESKLFYNDASVSRIANVYDTGNPEGIVSTKKFWKQELKDILFRYLPSFLKKYSKVDEMHFTIQYLQESENELDSKFYDTSNYEMYNIIKENKVNKTDDNIFKFIHLDGAHAPWKYGKDFTYKVSGTYDDGIDNSLTMAKAYLDMLKENGVYDNSAIIVMADHGFKTEENGEQRRNPILFVKGAKETHKSMQTSNKPIHFVDLEELYSDLISGKQTKDLFTNVKENRTRRFIDYKGGSIDIQTMTEYETTGTAWDNEKYHKTGNVYTKSW